MKHLMQLCSEAKGAPENTVHHIIESHGIYMLNCMYCTYVLDGISK